MQARYDDADRGLDAMRAGIQTSQMRERGDDTDRAVSAHAEIRHVVEEEHSRDTSLVEWRAQKCADEHVRTAWFIDHCGAKVVVVMAETFKTFGERVVAEVRSTADYNARGFTAAMRIDYFDASGRVSQAAHCLTDPRSDSVRLMKARRRRDVPLRWFLW